MTDYNYDKIVNPKNGEKLKIDTQKGKTIIKKYENIVKTNTKTKKLKPKNSSNNNIKLINLDSNKNEEMNPSNSITKDKKVDLNDLDLLADPQKKKRINKQTTKATRTEMSKNKTKIDKYIETSINNVKDNDLHKLDDEISYVASVSTINSSLIDNLSGGFKNNNENQDLNWNKNIKNNNNDIETLSMSTKKSVDDINSVNDLELVDNIKSVDDRSVKSRISEKYNLSDIIKRTKFLEDEVNNIKKLLKNLSNNL